MTDDFLFVDVTGARHLLNNFDHMPDVARAIVVDKIEAIIQALKEKVEDNIGDRLGTSKDKTYSGSSEHLINAVQTSVDTSGKGIKGRVFIDTDAVPYARIQEDGGTIGPHMIYPRDGKALAFQGSLGDRVIVASVMHPGATITGKHFMRDAYRSMSGKIGKDVQKAVIDGIRDQMHGTSS